MPPLYAPKSTHFIISQNLPSLLPASLVLDCTSPLLVSPGWWPSATSDPSLLKLFAVNIYGSLIFYRYRFGASIIVRISLREFPNSTGSEDGVKHRISLSLPSHLLPRALFKKEPQNIRWINWYTGSFNSDFPHSTLNIHAKM